MSNTIDSVDTSNVKDKVEENMTEFQKLQLELKSKNDIINSLIGQNFSKLKKLKDKHEKVVESLTKTYDENIKSLTSNYQLFKTSIQNKLKDSLTTCYKINNNKAQILTSINKELSSKITELEKENKDISQKLLKLDNDHKRLLETHHDLELCYRNTEQGREICMEKLLNIEKLWKQQQEDIRSYNNQIQQLIIDKEKLINELIVNRTETSKHQETISMLNAELSLVKNTQNDIYNKHLSTLNDLMNKQTMIDEKTLEIISLNSRISELEKKNILLDSNRKDLNIKITELITQIDSINSELLSTQKLFQQLKNENDILTEEKKYYIDQCDELKSNISEISESSILNMNKLHEEFNAERLKYTSEYSTEINNLKQKFETTISEVRDERDAKINERDSQIIALKSHIKSLTDSQYLVFKDMEKLKSENESLVRIKREIDDKINEMNISYKKNITDLKSIQEKEKDSLIKSYTEAMKRCQDTNELLQNRLNQSVETLGLSKSTISNLRETNEKLEKQLLTIQEDHTNMRTKYNDIINENDMLKDKLDKAVNLYNVSASKEKQYESQIKQLHLKNNQLIALTKKNLVTSKQ